MAKDSTVTNVDPGDDGNASWADQVKASCEAAFDDKTMHQEADAATITFDLDNGALQTVTITADRTLALSNKQNWRPFFIRIVQDGTGGHSVTWWANIRWPSGSAPSLSSGANAIDAFMFIPDGSGNYDGYFAGFGLS